MSMVSVIVPVYNAELYLERCLDSLVNQTLVDIEIICVNDGSTDSTPDILERYQKRYQNIKVCSQCNKGQVASRKAGLNLASGMYIGFVDADDWVETNMYEELLQKAEEFNAELVTCGYYLEGNYTTTHLDNIKEGLYESGSMQHLRNNTIYNYEKKETGIRGAVWCKLFERNVIINALQNISDDILIAEDKLCVIKSILECNSVYVIGKPLYHWVINNNSISHSDDVTYLQKIDNVYRYLISLYDHENFTDTMRNQCELYIVELLTLGINDRMGFKNQYMLRIDPYWLHYIEKNARLVVYGGDNVARQYMQQIQSRTDLTVIEQIGFDVDKVLDIEQTSYDYILVAVKNREKAQNVINQISQYFIPAGKILWFEQTEFYWKFAKAQGMLK